MKLKYFKADFTTTIEEIKRQYRKLAIKHHPDLGGDEEVMKQVNVEFDYLCKRNYNIHETAEGSTYTDFNQCAPDDVTSNFKDIIEQLIKMVGVEIELCGKFIWLSGSTYEHKAEIKALGFKWAGKKKRWYLAPKGWRKASPRELSMGEIRTYYGSQIVTAEGRRIALTA